MSLRLWSAKAIQSSKKTTPNVFGVAHKPKGLRQLVTHNSVFAAIHRLNAGPESFGAGIFFVLGSTNRGFNGFRGARPSRAWVKASRFHELCWNQAPPFQKTPNAPTPNIERRSFAKKRSHKLSTKDPLPGR